MQMHAPLGCGAALLNSVNIVIKRLTTTKQAEWEKGYSKDTSDMWKHESINLQDLSFFTHCKREIILSKFHFDKHYQAN